MTDEKLERMCVVPLPHLSFFFPSRPRRVSETDMPVVMRRIGILDPQIARRDLKIRLLRVPDDFAVVTAGRPQRKNAGRGFFVPFDLQGDAARGRIQASPPNQAGPAQAPGPRCPHRLPPTSRPAFIPLQGDRSAAPSVSQTDHHLRGGSRQAEINNRRPEVVRHAPSRGHQRASQKTPSIHRARWHSFPAPATPSLLGWTGTLFVLLLGQTLLRGTGKLFSPRLNCSKEHFSCPSPQRDRYSVRP